MNFVTVERIGNRGESIDTQYIPFRRLNDYVFLILQVSKVACEARVWRQKPTSRHNILLLIYEIDILLDPVTTIRSVSIFAPAIR